MMVMSFIFFFKQKTAYEMRISDWSSDVCSSDLYLEFFNVTKIYPTPKGPLTVVDGFNLLMDKGEFISLIGHSGCGKSTVLSMTAGLTGISRGGIVLDGREVANAGPDRAVVFQAPSLLPWQLGRAHV